jgi:hypothetical protein
LSFSRKFKNTTRSRDHFDLTQQQFIALCPISSYLLIAMRLATFTTHPASIKLSDFACEEALYDIAILCRMSGIDLGREAVPDATM